LAHVQHTQRQYTLPESGKKIADQAHRDGGAERLAAPAGQQTLAGDLALIPYDANLLQALALSLLKTAQPHDAPTLYLWQTVPGIGQLLSLVLLDAIHASDRCASVPDCVSSCRLVQWAQEAAGKRMGTSGKKIGHVPLQGALSAAATLFLRTNPPGPIALARLETTQAKGQAVTILAHKLARAVYDLRKRHKTFAMVPCLPG